MSHVKILRMQDRTIGPHALNMTALFDENLHPEVLSPVKRPDGRYVTSASTENKAIDPRIFLETQIKRASRFLTTTPVLRIFFAWLLIQKMGMKVDYFAEGEDQNPAEKIYAKPQSKSEDKDDDKITIENLGHATMLIKINGKQCLFDPVFHDLAPLIYPSMTKPFQLDKKITDLPQIDYIAISHDHRDHVDMDFYKDLVKLYAEQNWALPVMFVPMGNKHLFAHLGFEVHELAWHDAAQVGELTFTCTPADHRSGRNGLDAHKSLVASWTLSTEFEVIHFAGDTARLSDSRMDTLAANILKEAYQTSPSDAQYPDIINLVPGGPNYTRRDMEPTHQSTVDSLIFAFRLSISLGKMHEKVKAEGEFLMPAADWLNYMASIFMHHNRFELGPDRFNESVFIYNRLLKYLTLDPTAFAAEETRQAQKSVSSSLFHRRKDFILEGAKELRQLAAHIWPNTNAAEQQQHIEDFLKTHIHFPLINAVIGIDEILTLPHVEPGPSAHIPQTDKGKQMGH